MLLPERRKDCRENLGAHDLACAHPDGPLDGLALPGCGAHHGGGRCRQRLGVRLEFKRPLCRGKALLGAGEKFETDGAFERLDVPSHRRLSESKRARRAGQRAFPQDGEKASIEAPVAFGVTGGSEVALDTEFAKELGLPQFGEVQGTFSGGEHANVQQSGIDSLTVGDWTIKNLPILTLALRQLSEGLGVKRIDGCIGTNLLYHFLATLDFPHGELVLRRKTAKSLEQFAAASSGNSIAVPFWIASDHFMVGWGRVETVLPCAPLR
jgi:Aspartyl protease